jgi:hypothetical protein
MTALARFFAECFSSNYPVTICVKRQAKTVPGSNRRDIVFVWPLGTDTSQGFGIFAYFWQKGPDIGRCSPCSRGRRNSFDISATALGIQM